MRRAWLLVAVGLVTSCSSAGGGSDGGVSDAASPPDGALRDASTLGAWSFVETTETWIAGAIPTHIRPPLSGDECQDEYFAFTGGLAAVDFDEDGDEDLFVVGGGASPNRLYRNDGAGRFVDVAASFGLAEVGENISSVSFADADGDGDLDALVSHLYQDRALTYMRNEGTGLFTDATLAAGLSFAWDGVYSTTFGDVDRDGDLDLLISHWDNWLEENPPKRDHLWCNDGAGRFTGCSVARGVSEFFEAGLDHGLAASIVDLTGDGYPELLMAADNDKSVAFVGDGDGTFSLLFDRFPSLDHGMGVAVADFDGDLALDWFVTAIDEPWEPISESGNRLFLGDGAGGLVDATDAAGVREGNWGWAVCEEDFDLDGDRDLFHVTGYQGVISQNLPWPLGWERPEASRSRFFVNDGRARFDERGVALGFDTFGITISTVCADFDGDGDVDIATLDNPGALRVYENRLGPRPWLGLNLSQPGDNRRAVGAHLEVRAGEYVQHLVVEAANTFASMQPYRITVGFPAPVDTVEVEVRWPDGAREIFVGVETGGVRSLARGSGTTL